MVKSFKINLLDWLKTKIYVKDEIDTKLANKSDTGHIHDDKYYTETEMDTKLNGKANSSHTHNIGDISNLQSVLNGKANTSHTHNDTYYTKDEINTRLGDIETILNEILGV